MIGLKNAVNKKIFYQNQNEFKFNKQQKIKRSKIFTLNQMLQRLLMTLAQITAGNTSENLLNKTSQIIYFWVEQTKLLKKYKKI